MRTAIYALASVAAVGLAAPASATIVIVDSSSIQGENVLFNQGVTEGTTVDGFTQLGTEVLFTGMTVDGGTIIRANGGQARVEGSLDGATNNPNDTLALSSLNFGLAGGGTFNNLEFNVFGGSATSGTFTLIDNGGMEFLFPVNFGTGENKFGFQGIDGQTISNVSLSFGAGGIGDVRQIRLDESVTAPVPEPGTWAMMLFGFGALGFSMRRRRSDEKGKQRVRFAI